MTIRLRYLFALIVGICLTIVIVSPSAQTTIANNAADLAGHIIMVADSTNARTVTNLFTFNRSPSAPFAVAVSSGKVANLDADLVDGVEAAALKGYTLSFVQASFNPADATTYVMGINAGAAVPGSAGTRRIYIPRTGSITTVYVSFYNNAVTLGTSETSTISVNKNSGTVSTISALVNNAATQFLNTTGLNISVTATDYVELQWVTPTWVTNPTNLVISGYFYIE